MKIISTDFDGTICSNAWPDIGKPNIGFINYLIKMRDHGYKIILNTMREGESLNQAIEWCKQLGLEFDAINDNLPEMQELFGNNPRKIYADWYFDDHNALDFGRKMPTVKNRAIRKDER